MSNLLQPNIFRDLATLCNAGISISDAAKRVAKSHPKIKALYAFYCFDGDYCYFVKIVNWQDWRFPSLRRALHGCNLVGQCMEQLPRGEGRF